MSFIGIDIGASFIKGAILDVEANAIHSVVRRPFPTFLKGLPVGHREVEAYRIVDEVQSVLTELSKISMKSEGVFMCGQMHGFVLCDEHGAARSNFVSWQDTRSLSTIPSCHRSHFGDLEKIVGNRKKLLGNELRPGSPVSVLYALVKDQSAPSRQVYPSSLCDFVVANLTGTMPRTSISNAAAHGLLRVDTGEWDFDLIRELPFKHLQWPEICAVEDSVAAQSRSSERFFTPIGDQQAAVLGSGINPAELSINIATGSQVTRIVSNYEAGEYQVRPFFENSFLRTVTHIPAGRAINALVRLVSELAQTSTTLEIWEYINTRSEMIEETDLRTNIAFFPSSFGSVGYINGISEDNLTVGHLFSSAFVNMAENFQRAAERIWQNRDWSRIVLSGGLAQKSARLQKEIFKKLGESWRSQVNEEDTLIGLLKLANHKVNKTCLTSSGA